MSAHMFDLTGRVAVITGGATGLGLGMAEALKGLGCTVSIWGRRKDVVAKAAGDLGVHSQVCDVADKEAVDAAFAQTLSDLGRVDGMFANAGVGGVLGSSLARSESDWDKVLNVNVKGVAYCCAAAAAHMVERAKNGDPFGRLVATSSLASSLGAPRNEPYSATKGAVNSLMRSLAGELARYEITANAILPGFAISDMTKELIADDRFNEAVMRRLKMRRNDEPRYGEPADYGGIAAYLMSNASGYHTGDCFTIDGGFSLG